MNGLFQDMLLKKITVYLDNITVYLTMFEEHIATLRKVFRHIREARLSINKSKLLLCQPRLDLLGHIVDATSCHPDSKVSAIVNWPRSMCVAQV